MPKKKNISMAAADVQQHRQEVTQQQQQQQQHGVVVPKLLLRWDGVVVTARKFSRSLLASCAIDFDTLSRVIMRTTTTKQSKHETTTTTTTTTIKQLDVLPPADAQIGDDVDNADDESYFRLKVAKDLDVALAREIDRVSLAIDAETRAIAECARELLDATSLLMSMREHARRLPSSSSSISTSTVGGGNRIGQLVGRRSGSFQSLLNYFGSSANSGGDDEGGATAGGGTATTSHETLPRSAALADLHAKLERATPPPLSGSPARSWREGRHATSPLTRLVESARRTHALVYHAAQEAKALCSMNEDFVNRAINVIARHHHLVASDDDEDEDEDDVMIKRRRMVSQARFGDASFAKHGLARTRVESTLRNLERSYAENFVLCAFPSQQQQEDERHENGASSREQRLASAGRLACVMMLRPLHARPSHPLDFARRHSWLKGFFIALIVASTISFVWLSGIYVSNAHSLRKEFWSAWPLFRLLLLPAVWIGCWCLMCKRWRHINVNYFYLLDIDPETELGVRRSSEIFLSVIATCLCSIMLWLLTRMTNTSLCVPPLIAHYITSANLCIPADWYPMLMIVIFSIVLVAPPFVLYPSTRFWLARVTCRCAAAPVLLLTRGGVPRGGKPISFCENFVADIFTSMAIMLQDVQYAVLVVILAALQHHNNGLRWHADDVGMVVGSTTMMASLSFATKPPYYRVSKIFNTYGPPIFTALPYVWRLAQCLTRYRDDEWMQRSRASTLPSRATQQRRRHSSSPNPGDNDISSSSPLSSPLLLVSAASQDAHVLDADVERAAGLVLPASASHNNNAPSSISHLHLINAGKYLVTLIAILMAALGGFRHVEGPRVHWTPFRITWFSSLILSTVYSYAWDVLVDMKLVKIVRQRCNNLRIHIDWDRGFRLLGTSIPPTAISSWRRAFATKLACRSYVMWILASNLVGRLAWSLSIVPGFAFSSGAIPSQLSVTILAVIELCRRAQWAIVRVDHEQHENASHYRDEAHITVPSIEEERMLSKLRSTAWKANNRATDLTLTPSSSSSQSNGGGSAATYDASGISWHSVLRELEVFFDNSAAAAAARKDESSSSLSPSMRRCIPPRWCVHALQPRHIVEAIWALLATCLIAILTFYMMGYKLPG